MLLLWRWWGASGGKVLPSGRVPPMIAESFCRCRGCLQCSGCLPWVLETVCDEGCEQRVLAMQNWKCIRPRPPIGCRSWDRSCCEAQATLAERQVGDGKGCCWDGSRLQKFGEAACDGVIMGVGEGFGGTGR